MKWVSLRRLGGARRLVVIVGVTTVLGIGAVLVLSNGGSSNPVASTPTVRADRGSVVATVTDSASISTSSVVGQAAASAASTGYPVYPLAAGRVVETLVVPGQVVSAGQALAVLADPSAADLVLQAQVGLANATQAYDTFHRSQVAQTRAAQGVAQLAVRVAQLKLGGLLTSPSAPPSSQVAAAQLTLKLAQQQLAALSNPSTVDVTTAQLGAQKAQADLDALLAAAQSSRPLASQVAAAQINLTLAQQQLAALVNPSIIDRTTAQLGVQTAQADLDALLAAAQSSQPLPSQIAAAQLTVKLAQQQLEALSNPSTIDVTTAQLAVQKAQADLDALLSAPIASQRTAAIDQARLDLANAKIAFVSLHALSGPPSAEALNLSALQLGAAKSAVGLARLHQLSLTVRAPVSGTVTGVFVTPGMQADPTVMVAAVADLKHLYVSIQMSEFDIVHVRTGDRALVNVAALGGTALRAKVVAVAPVGINNSGVVQFPVTVALTKVRGNLRPGMLASVQLITSERRGVVRVPLNAVSTMSGGNNGGETYVTVLSKTGHQQIRIVSLGLVGANYAEVVKGLKGGERLVLPQTIAATSGGGSSGNAPPGIGVPSSNQGQNGN